MTHASSDTQLPEGLVFLALHVQNHVNNVLQDLGTSNIPRLGHMAHQEDGYVMFFSNVQ